MRDGLLKIVRNRWFWYGIGFVAAIAVLWPTIWTLSHHFFPTSYLIIDDGNEYVLFTKYNFFEYFFFDHRPVTAFFMGLGFTMFGHATTPLLVYASLFFALTIVALFILFKEASGSCLLAAIFSAAALFSRLNWYYYAGYFGIMESLALGMAALALFFMIRFIRNRGHGVWLVLSAVFTLLACWSHERYILLFAVPVIAALIGFAGWKRKLLFAGISAGIVAVFLVDRLWISRGTLMAATGASIVWDIASIFRNFFKLLVNTFTLYDDVWYLSGVTNAMLDDWHRFVFAATGILLLAIVLMGLVLFVLDLKKKRFANSFIFLAIGVFYGFTAAGGSVSTGRVEPRWMFTSQMFLFALCAFSIANLCSYLEIKKKGTDASGPIYQKPRPDSSFGLSLLVALGVIGTGVYTINNKVHYYIDDGADQALYFQHSILDHYKALGATELLVAADRQSQNSLGGLIPQWDLEKWHLVDLDQISQYASGNPSIALYMVRGGAVTYVQNASRKNILTKWTLASFETLVYGDRETLNVQIEDVRFPNRPANGVTAIVNGEIVLTHYSIEGGFDYDLPIKKGQMNTIQLLPDFTYNPSKEGTGADIRDLGLYIVSFGG